MHVQWRLKSQFATATGTYQRLTGQATTAIGNAIVNLIVHNDFVIRNLHHLQFMVFLGDDNLMMFKNKP